jgi:glycosyltransferase involved in cell wall biosynthesis
MRLALLTHKVDLLDGQGRVNYEVVMAALNAGHEVTVVAEFCSDAIAQHPHGRFVRMRERHIPTQLLRNLWYATGSARWLRQHRNEFDLVQANGFVTWEPADIVAVHFVHTAWRHNPYFPFRWSSFSPYAWYQLVVTLMNGHFEERAFQSARALVAVSRFTAGEVAALGVPPEKITVVYNGVDTVEFAPGEGDRASFGLPAKPPMGLFVGDIKTTRKNLETVLQAMTAVPEMHLAVAGATEGSPYPELARTLGLADRVHFIGKTSKIALLMRSVDVFVFPSRYEAHPLVLMEALASGLPIVVSGNFGAADYIGDGAIVLKDPNDPVALAEALRTVVTSPERRRAMAVAAREQALTMQWKDTAAGYLRVYDRLMENAGKLM